MLGHLTRKNFYLQLLMSKQSDDGDGTEDWSSRFAPILSLLPLELRKRLEIRNVFGFFRSEELRLYP